MAIVTNHRGALTMIKDLDVILSDGESHTVEFVENAWSRD